MVNFENLSQNPAKKLANSMEPVDTIGKKFKVRSQNCLF